MSNLGRSTSRQSRLCKGEGCFAGVVFQEAWGVLHWVISKGCYVLEEFLKCGDAGLFEAVHSLADFEVDVSIWFDGKLVFFHEFIGYDCVVDVEVLVIIHRGDKVEVFLCRCPCSGILCVHRIWYC